MSNAKRTFVCCCCGHNKCEIVGLHTMSISSERHSFKNSREVYQPLVSCANCSHTTAHPLPSPQDLQQSYQSLDYWQSRGVENNLSKSSWLKNLTYNGAMWERYIRAKRHLQLIKNHDGLFEDAKIIDLGSGISPFLYHCRQYGIRDLYALDPSKEICGFLKNQRITAYSSLLEDFIKRDELPHFDVMVLSHTLEHMTNPDETILGLKDLLSDHGMLLIVVPYQDHLRSSTSRLHLHFFNERSMTHLIAKCGYQGIFVESERFNIIERAIVRGLDVIKGKKRTQRKIKRANGIRLTKPIIQFVHRVCWRPLKQLSGMKINIFVSSRELFALVKKESRIDASLRQNE